MNEHFKSYSAIFPITTNKNNQVLLAKEKIPDIWMENGIFAGSGHVDENEAAMQAVVRELKEEIDIVVDIKEVEFAHVSHRVGTNGIRTYFDIYFLVKNYSGTAKIAEPDKCSELKWFDIDNLPDDMIDIRREVMFYQMKKYSEYILK